MNQQHRAFDTFLDNHSATPPAKPIGERAIGFEYRTCRHGQALCVVDFVAGHGFDLEMRPDEMRRMAAALQAAADDLDKGLRHRNGTRTEFVWREGRTVLENNKKRA